MLRAVADGVIRTIAGTGAVGRGVIGTHGVGFGLNDPEDVLATVSGDLLVSDGGNGRVLRILSNGIVELVAGRKDNKLCNQWW